MTDSKYIVFDGKILNEQEFKLGHRNRAFQYGDGLFETMHASGSKVQFFYEHIERLISGMKVLKMEIPVRFSVDTLGLQNDISKILTKNKIYKGARVRITVFRHEGGFYAPQSNECHYLIECAALDSEKFELNPKGLLIDVFEDMQKPINAFSKLKLTSAIYYVMAGIFKNENKLDECLIINTKGNIAETISSNIFIVRENTIFTPSIREGCLPGIMRQKVIELARKAGYTVHDDLAQQIQDIMTADEIFLTNAVKGIQWVLGFKQRRYFNNVAKTLINELNKLCFPELPQNKDAFGIIKPT